MRILILSLLILINACGYKFAGIENQTDSNNKIKYHISEVKNSFYESDYYSLLNNEIVSFFTKYGSLSSKDMADYLLLCELISAKTSSSITSISNQAVTSNINLKLKIKVTDKIGKTVFEKVFNNVENFTLTKNISQNIINRDAAFKKSIRNTLLDFKYEFESH